jgi:hypothetical protein
MPISIFGLDGYDFSHTAIWASPDRGHSPEVWDRALGSSDHHLTPVVDTRLTLGLC